MLFASIITKYRFYKVTFTLGAFQKEESIGYKNRTIRKWKKNVFVVLNIYKLTKFSVISYHHYISVISDHK